MRRKVLFIFLFCLVNLFAAPACFAAEPLRVAVLPVINQSHAHDETMEAVILKALHAKFHRPLSAIVPIYQMIPDDDVSAVLPPGIRKRPVSLKFKAEMLSEAADKLHADIVIGAVITDLRASTLVTRTGDYLQNNHLTIHLVLYKTSTQQYFDKHDSKYYVGEPMLYGSMDYLAQDIMDHLLHQVIIKPE
jgi:hypothetical protein